MCFTIDIHTNRKAIERRFTVDASVLKDFDFDYFYRAFANPQIPVIVHAEDQEVRLMQWGLIPAWARDRAHAREIRKGTYNARGESIHQKVSFREAFQRGRCLVLAKGFFEWQHVPGAKIPWYIRLKEEGPMAFAGLWERWKDPDSGTETESCTIITTRANPLMEKIHNSQKRMPVILTRGKDQEWIGEGMEEVRARQLLLPLDQELMHAHTVHPKVSSSSVDPKDPSLLAPHEYHVPGRLF